MTWDDFLRASTIPGMPRIRKTEIDRQLERFKYHLERKDSNFFASKLPTSLHWLCFRHFEANAVFLDIETSGMGQAYITIVGCADKQGYQSWIREINLTSHKLKEFLAPYKMVVSFYGSGFDIPFMRREFPGLPLYSLPHFDLCLCGKKIGLHGGLKKVEKTLGISRPQDISGMSGYQAVLLWQEYQMQNKQQALEQLLRYNREDTCNLVELAELIYTELEKDYLKVDGMA